MLLDNLSVLIASPDLESRTKLREVLRTFVYKGTILQERTLSGLAARFTARAKGEKINTLFISSRFGRAAIAELLREAQHISAKLPPIVVFINAKQLGHSTEVASLYLEGIDGFIREPYSSEELLALIQTLGTSSKRAASTEAKMRKAAQFLLFDAMAHLDEITHQQMRGEDPGGYPLKNLRAVSAALKKLAERNLPLYYELLFSVLEKAKPATEAELQRKTLTVNKRPLHPGAVLREMMRSRMLSRERLLSSLRVEPADFDALLNEQRGIDHALARELARTLGMTSVEWLRMQREYDTRAKRGKTA